MGWAAQRALRTAVAAVLDPQTRVTLRANAGLADTEICRWLQAQQWQFGLHTCGHPPLTRLSRTTVQ